MRRALPLDTDMPSSAALLAEIHRRIGSCVESELLNALAFVPGCLERFWEAAEPVYASCAIRSAADDMRREATRLSGQIHFPNHLTWLADHDFTREDSRQIRYIVEIFYNLEPVFVLLAAFAREWLQTAGPTEAGMNTFECSSDLGPVFTGQVLLPGQTSQIARLFPEPEAAPSLPHPFHRALSAWPSYMRRLSADLDNTACAVPYAAALDAVRRSVSDFIAPVTSAAGLRGDRPAASALTSTVESCIGRSCEAIVLSSSLRHSFIKAEIAARTRNIRSWLDWENAATSG